MKRSHGIQMLAVQLRPYQSDLENNIKSAFSRTKRVLAQLPTGGGKTALASSMVGKALNRLRRVLFIVHRKELVEQTSKTFTKYGIIHSFIASGRPYDPDALVQLCSVDTLKARMAKGLVLAPDLVIWDECHHLAAAGWTRVFESFPDAYHVGLSATPVRTDGSGLDTHFGEMVHGPDVAWLIEQGYLSQYRVFAPAQPDLQGVKKAMGDYAVTSLADIMDKPRLHGDIVAHWKRHCEGMRTVGFAVNVKHSEHIVKAFQEEGIAAAHLDGETPAAERADIIRKYADGEILVLWNVGLFGEGFDLSAIAGRDVTIDAVILARPTQSLALHLQQVGRALRPSPGKIAIILDHAGNSFRHGLPCDARSWGLAGIAKKARTGDEGPPPPYTCKTCYGQVRRPCPPTCPICGAAIVPEAVPLPQPTKAELKEIDRVAREAAKLSKEQARQAKLAEEARKKAERAAAKEARAAAKALKEEQEKAEREALAASRRAEEHACETEAELRALGKARGYEYASAWAKKLFATRKKSRPSGIFRKNT